MSFSLPGLRLAEILRAFCTKSWSDKDIMRQEFKRSFLQRLTSLLSALR